jgi:hypothetical protein
VQAQILAAAALLIDIGIALLPVYGNGQTHFGLVVLPFPFWIGLANFLSIYAIAAVILVGLVSFAWRSSFAAGVFVAAAPFLGLRVVSSAIITIGWWQWLTTLILGPQTLESVLLFLAAASELRSEETPSGSGALNPETRQGAKSAPLGEPLCLWYGWRFRGSPIRQATTDSDPTGPGWQWRSSAHGACRSISGFITARTCAPPRVAKV